MKRILCFSVLFCFAMSITTLAQAQTTTTRVLPGVVGPDIRGGETDFTTTEGNGSGDENALGNFTNTVLTVYNADIVASAGINPGDVLTGLSFRVGGGIPFNPAPNFTVDNYIIDLGISVNSAGSLVDNFNANAVGGALTQVHSGSVDFNAADFPNVNPNTGTGIANSFGPTIEFDTNFTYTGGDLLLRYTHTAPLSLNGAPVVTSRGDNIASTFVTPDFADSRVQTLFGSGFNNTERDFDAIFGENFATIVQFDVVTSVPEPTSAVLLMGLGIIGVARRRKM